MKDFQLNYTTPAQSKWLLALGVPADSADCFIDLGDRNRYIRETFDYEIISGQSFFEYFDQIFIPCWSVGRLIEIYHICDQPGCTFSFNVCFPNLVSEMIHEISLAKERGWIDFSKLEDFMKRSNGNNSVL